MTEQEAIRLGESRFWETMSMRERAFFQLFERRLCMPFTIFHEAVESALGRPVWTHEFGLNMPGLRKEIMGDQEAPSLQEIMDMIPTDKRVIVSTCEAPHD